MYLFPPGTAARNNRKLQGLRGSRGMGLMLRNGFVSTLAPAGQASTVTQWRGWNPVPVRPYVPPPVLPPAPAIPGSPVPQNYPTNQIFVNSDGVQWQFNTSSGQWIPISGAFTATTTSTYAGTPVPAGYPTNQIYTDTAGNQWQYNSAMGTWTITGSLAMTLATSTSGLSPSGSPVSIVTSPAPSSVQPILDWLSQNTLISAVPNWVPAVGVGLLAFKFMGKK